MCWEVQHGDCELSPLNTRPGLVIAASILVLASRSIALDFRQVTSFGINAWSSNSEIRLRLSLGGFSLLSHSTSRTGIVTETYTKRGQTITLKSTEGAIFQVESSQVNLGQSVVSQGDPPAVVLKKLGTPTRVLPKSRRAGESWMYEDFKHSNTLNIRFQNGRVRQFSFSLVSGEASR